MNVFPEMPAETCVLEHVQGEVQLLPGISCWSWQLGISPVHEAAAV